MFIEKLGYQVIQNRLFTFVNLSKTMIDIIYDISEIIFTGFKYLYIQNIALKWGGPKMLFDSKLVSKTSQE